MMERLSEPLSSELAFPAPLVGSKAHAADLLALTKPRLTLLVVATATAGYYLGARDGLNIALLVNTVAGTALVAAGAAVFNQVIERDTDALMRRTRRRPLPTGRIQPLAAWRFAFVLSIAGLAALAVGANLLAAVVALTTLLSYVAVYTPLKRRTSLATLVGGIPGALPPLIGWAAATGTTSLGGWVLVAIVFLWQMPHFLAIAWMCRDDYRNAGLPMLPVIEPDGRSTAAQVLLYSATLVPVSLAPTLVSVAGRIYFAGALVLGLAFLALGIRFARNRAGNRARALFFGSIGYLPLLFGLMLWNRG